MRIDLHNLPYSPPYEYWCYNCGTCNLCFCVTDNCLGCGSDKIIKDELGGLDLDKLRSEYE
jgi:hypothetical protein